MNKEKTIEGIIKTIYILLSVVIFFLMVAIALDTFDLAIDNAFYNLLLVLPILGLSLIAFRRLDVAVAFSGIIAFAFVYLDQLVYSSRLTHIRFGDFKLIAQAARVANRYNLIWNMELTRILVIILSLSALLLFIYCYYDLRYSKKAIFISGIILAVASTLIIMSGLLPSAGHEDFDYTSDTEQRGLFYSWYCQAQESRVEAPEGYSFQKASDVLNQYAYKEGGDDVRLIVIMNESLADYSLLGTTQFKDPLPYMHALVDDGEAFEGELCVNVIGGGTPNTEFEFLTGFTTAFLPKDSTPYLQYVNHRMESIVSDLGSKSKIAIHPYYSEEWNRTQVYRCFGFDRYISGADFGTYIETNGKNVTSLPDDNIVSFGEGPHYVRGLISDKSCYERIQKEKADFTFAVTMQNHGGYDYKGDDFTNDEYVTEAQRNKWSGQYNNNIKLYNLNIPSVEEELYDVNQYLTLSNLSDQAFEKLIEDLKDDERKTIVLLFGDHQPGLMIPEYYVHLKNDDEPNYTVPYVLWANYEVSFDAPEMISANYLSAVLKKNAGLGLTAWDQFRLDMMNNYPVICTWSVLDKDGKQVNKDKLKAYKYIQYMMLFDKR